MRDHGVGRRRQAFAIPRQAALPAKQTERSLNNLAAAIPGTVAVALRLHRMAGVTAGAC